MNRKLTRRQGLMSLIVVTAAIVISLAHWTLQPGQQRLQIASTAAEPHAQPTQTAGMGTQTPASSVQVAVQSAEQQTATATDSLNQYTSDKYQTLFSGSFMQGNAADELRRELIERERIAVAINTARQGHDATTKESLPQQEQALALVDERIRRVLHPTDYAAYEALRDSDIEQFQLDDYAGGISNIAPLRAEDRRAILRIKLAYKQRFRQVLLDSGILSNDLGPDARRSAYAVVSQALEEYKNSYLQEVRQHLYDDEQYALLNNYETGEFMAELAKLRSIANGG